MESEPSQDHDETTPEPEDAPRLRAITKANPLRADRLSSDHIHLSPKAQRRMAMGRRSGF